MKREIALCIAEHNRELCFTQGKIEINLQNGQGQPLPNTSAELLRAADSSLIKIALSDEKGQAFFEGITPGRWPGKSHSRKPCYRLFGSITEHPKFDLDMKYQNETINGDLCGVNFGHIITIAVVSK